MSVYNGERFLSESIDSILCQTYRDYEFIIVDDGSSDNSFRILDSYAKENQNIKIIRNDSNIGLTKSLNKALLSARGNYVARMDADDISIDTRLEKQIDLLEQNVNVGLVSCNSIVIDENGHAVKNVLMPLTINSLIRKRNYLVHGSVIIRKDVLDKLGGYDEEMRYAQDYELWLRITGHYEIRCIEEYLYKCRVHPEAILNRKYFQQIFYTALAKSKALHGKDRNSLAFLMELVYCYTYISKMGLPLLLRKMSLIK
jgi:glycosyltransferase involved in cell wall biosynthesis